MVQRDAKFTDRYPESPAARNLCCRLMTCQERWPRWGRHCLPLPVSIEVVDKPVVIAQNLAVDGTVHLVAPEVLLNSTLWYVPRRLLKLDDSAIQTKSKTLLMVSSLQAPGSCLTQLHPDHLLLEISQNTRNNADRPPRGREKWVG
jgi:hypothetical protein